LPIPSSYVVYTSYHGFRTKDALHHEKFQIDCFSNVSSICISDRDTLTDRASCRSGRTYQELGDDETFLRLMSATTEVSSHHQRQLMWCAVRPEFEVHDHSIPDASAYIFEVSVHVSESLDGRLRGRFAPLHWSTRIPHILSWAIDTTRLLLQL
jgi:hypothetical protein